MPAASLESLPPELLANILDIVPFDDQKSLSATNSAFRTLLLPSLFKSIKLTTTSDCKLTEALGRHVTHMTVSAEADLEADHLPFDTKLDPFRMQRHRARRRGEKVDGEESDTDASDEDIDPEKWTKPLSKTAREVLAGQLPKATSICLDFSSFDFGWYHDHPNNGFYIFEDVENDPKTTLAFEDTLNWRALMRDVWAALAQNTCVTDVTIKGFVPKPVSTWGTSEFASFLGRIKSLDFASIHSADNGAGWCSQTNHGYIEFLSQLDHYFYQHCESLESFRIVGTVLGNVGGGWLGEYSRHAPHSMQTTSMPKLSHFEMKGCFIDGRLANFLAARADTLQTVKLSSCSSVDQYVEHGVYNWSGLFSTIAQSQPKRLVTFDIISLEDDSQGDEEGDRDKGDKETQHMPVFARERLETARERLGVKEDDPRLWFLYSSNTDKYGDTWLNDEETVERFEAGNDWAEYRKLLDIVGANRANNT